MQEQRSTLKKIFIANGLDPFDAFLLPEHKWPQEARDLIAATRHERRSEAERIEIAEHRREAGERFDANE